MALLTRKVQVTFEMDLEISEVPPDEIEVTDEHGNPSPEGAAQLAGFQNEMLRAILTNPFIQRAYLRRRVVQEMEGIRLDTLESLVPEMRGDEEDMIAPLVPQLSTGAQEYFQYAVENRQWPDATTEMYEHIKINVTGCTVTGL